MSSSASSALIVEDNPATRRLLEMILSGAGYAVVTAGDAPAALAALDERSFDVVLMDLQLPGLSGFSLTRVLRSDPRMRSLKIVAVTSYATNSDRERALHAGCDAFISKPIDTRAFPRQVAEVLAQA